MTDSQVPVVSLRHVRKAYPGKTGERLALADITFDVTRGEFVCVVGPSGAGKTTLLRCLAGLMPPTSGAAMFEGAPLRRVPDQVGIVFQDYSRSLFPWLTVSRNIALPLKVRGISKADRAGRIAEMLASVGLSDAGRQYPWQLSGGMQQRVAIARALAYRPDLLLMDEPFASVDAQTRFELEDLILRIRDEFGVTVVFVTHDIDEAVYLADRVVVLSASPGVVSEIVDITLPKPRDQIVTKGDDAFSGYRQHLLGVVMARLRWLTCRRNLTGSPFTRIFSTTRTVPPPTGSRPRWWRASPMPCSSTTMSSFAVRNPRHRVDAVVRSGRRPDGPLRQVAGRSGI